MYGGLWPVALWRYGELSEGAISRAIARVRSIEGMTPHKQNLAASMTIQSYRVQGVSINPLAHSSRVRTMHGINHDQQPTALPLAGTLGLI